jgi:alanine racemase
MGRVITGGPNRLYIDLNAISHNLRKLKSRTPNGVKLAGAVKADAYGHGLLPVSRELARAGIDCLAVQEVAEGAILRKAGIQLPLMVLVDHGPEQALVSATLGLTPTIFRMDTARALSDAAQALSGEVSCRVKVDTGMGRLGLDPAETLEFVRACDSLPGLKVIGLMSHFANSGIPHDSYTQKQTRLFIDLLAQMEQAGLDCGQSSICNSGGLLVPPGGLPPKVNMIRLGIAMYGGFPSNESRRDCSTREAMSLITKLAAVRKVKAGSMISYGMTYKAPRDTLLGVVPLGYSDGYPRSASNQAHMLVAGQRVPVRGRVCMNLTVLDLGGLDQVPQPGDPVTVLGGQGDEYISAEDLAGWAGTISYEIFTSLGNANRRRYIRR